MQLPSYLGRLQGDPIGSAKGSVPGTKSLSQLPGLSAIPQKRRRTMAQSSLWSPRTLPIFRQGCTAREGLPVFSEQQVQRAGMASPREKRKEESHRAGAV